MLHVQMFHSNIEQDLIYSIMKVIKYQTCSSSYLNMTKVVLGQQRITDAITLLDVTH